ncbi:hypothetical protein ACERK3_10130 [Phycisphaerales bacterium AB-hyl4]|uniref:Flagellar hook-length control protein FliK n=1 Tax=Natronomicrosphaera hydrolytica TaxID=3242702 RepID=A0ABV4U6Q4_9BACT
MVDSSQLLRMLEPTVRPVPTPEGRAASSGNVPIEQRSFESLLAEATSGEAGDIDEAGAATDAPAGGSANLLGPLSQVGAIENASLRALVERGEG